MLSGRRLRSRWYNPRFVTPLHNTMISLLHHFIARAAERTPDAPAGMYVLNVNARWEQGDVTYWFYILIP